MNQQTWDMVNPMESRMGFNLWLEERDKGKIKKKDKIFLILNQNLSFCNIYTSLQVFFVVWIKAEHLSPHS